MSFSEMRISAAAFTHDVTAKLILKMPFALEKAKGLDFIPYTVKGNAWAPGPFDGICWWTNGFWPGEMWEMYRLTRQEAYKTQMRQLGCPVPSPQLRALRGRTEPLTLAQP